MFQLIFWKIINTTRTQYLEIIFRCLIFPNQTPLHNIYNTIFLFYYCGNWYWPYNYRIVLLSADSNREVSRGTLLSNSIPRQNVPEAIMWHKETWKFTAKFKPDVCTCVCKSHPSTSLWWTLVCTEQLLSFFLLATA